MHSILTRNAHPVSLVYASGSISMKYVYDTKQDLQEIYMTEYIELLNIYAVIFSILHARSPNKIIDAVLHVPCSNNPVTLFHIHVMSHRST